MFVGMAVGAQRKLQFVNCRLARRKVTLLALHLGVFALERVLAGGMVLNGKGGRLPSIHGMARRALSRPGPLGKLPAVRVWRVAIRALGKRQRLFKISAFVTPFTGNFKMHAQQRIFRLRVVELLTHRRRIDFFPARCVVAGLACALKLALVRIDVAVVTSPKRQPLIARQTVSSRRVALLALHLRVRPGQGIARLDVIELGGLLPIDFVVTLNTVLPKLSFVKIRMARHAIGR